MLTVFLINFIGLLDVRRREPPLPPPSAPSSAVPPLPPLLEVADGSPAAYEAPMRLRFGMLGAFGTAPVALVTRAEDPLESMWLRRTWNKLGLVGEEDPLEWTSC